MNSTRLASWLIIMVIGVFTLIIAKNLLIPLVLAVTIWYIIITLAEVLRKYTYSGKGGHTISQIAATVIIITLLFVAIEIIVGSVESMVEQAPKYQENFQNLLEKGISVMNLDQMPSFSTILNEVDFGVIAGDLGAGVSGFAGSLLLVIVYLVFLLIEQRLFPRKFKALFVKNDQFDRAAKTMNRIHHSIRTYIGIKAFTSLLTGGISWIILTAVGLDFAIFWAFLIFLLNFIPAIGSLIATLFPSLFALVQFEGLTQFAIVLFGIGTLQVLIGSLLEPKLMGNTLNISSLVVILSLVIWGSIWGITGMILSAPITVSAIIILAEFEKTRPIAILLSANSMVGEQKEATESASDSPSS